MLMSSLNGSAVAVYRPRQGAADKIVMAASLGSKAASRFGVSTSPHGYPKSVSVVVRHSLPVPHRVDGLHIARRIARPDYDVVITRVFGAPGPTPRTPGMRGGYGPERRSVPSRAVVDADLDVNDRTESGPGTPSELVDTAINDPGSRLEVGESG